jgi:hypothetical protein
LWEILVNFKRLIKVVLLLLASTYKYFNNRTNGTGIHPRKWNLCQLWSHSDVYWTTFGDFTLVIHYKLKSNLHSLVTCIFVHVTTHFVQFINYVWPRIFPACLRHDVTGHYKINYHHVANWNYCTIMPEVTRYQ